MEPRLKGERSPNQLGGPTIATPRSGVRNLPLDCPIGAGLPNFGRYIATMLRALDRQLGEDFVSFIHSFGLLRSDMTPCGLPMSVSTAHALCELRTGPPLNQRDLARRLGLRTSTVSRLVDQLEAKSWATRTPDVGGADSRVRLVELTNTGCEVADQVLEARTARFSQLLAAVPPEKQHDVIEALTLLQEAAHAIA